MNVDDLILVSIDDHVVEPPDMFERHAPAKYRDRVPHVVMGDDGIEKWLFEGQDGRLDGPERGRHAGRRRSGASTPSASPRCARAPTTSTSACAT